MSSSTPDSATLPSSLVNGEGLSTVSIDANGSTRMLSTSPKWKNATCVFCGSSEGNDAEFLVSQIIGFELGRLIPEAACIVCCCTDWESFCRREHASVRILSWPV